MISRLKLDDGGGAGGGGRWEWEGEGRDIAMSGRDFGGERK